MKLHLADNLAMPPDAARKKCKVCPTELIRVDGESSRKWAYRRLCESCERENLKSRILRAIKVNENGCWIWQQSAGTTGYGQISVHDVNHRVHQLSYRLWKGDYSSELDICHKCDTPLCCNPDHLFSGTAKDNMADCKSKGRNEKPPVHSGESHHNANLTDEKIAEMKRLRATENFSQRKLSKLFKCSQSTVWRIINGHTRDGDK